MNFANARDKAKGVAYPAIGEKDFFNGIITLPPIEEQQRIVAKIEELLPYVDRYAAAYEKLEQFNAKFPEDMKKSILQYAIQGKLVEQRPEEGTGEELYRQIQYEKQRLIKEGKIKKEKPLPEIAEDEIPFDIPESWKTRIIQQLTEYISVRTGNNTISDEILSQELAYFLVEDVSSHSTKYAEFIGEFVLKNEQNKEIQECLNRIRQGSILYIGLSHSIGETGSIKKPLTLYLGTEVLFSLAGYNGAIFQQFANDFFAQVRIANSEKSKKITLRYFSEIKKEIDDFFGTASEIVECKRVRLLDKPAMKAITEGCQTAADVDVKKSDFYYELQYGFGITEDSRNDYYCEENFTSNLESFDYDDEEDKRKKKETAIKLISHINKLRNGNRFCSDIEAEHIIVTNTRATLLISKEQADIIKASEGLDSICNFAVSLDRITSLLWYKLGNGFSQSKFPSSVNAALKARIVLSASIARNAEKEFSRIKKEYADGIIDDDQVAARIITLRNKPVLPEDLKGDDIDEIMNFTPEYLSRYEEQIKNNQKALSEKEAVIESLKADSERKLSVSITNR